MSVVLLDVIRDIGPPIIGGVGTGFVVYSSEETVLIMTNEHNITGALTINIRLPGGNQLFTAELVASDAEVDLAIVRLVGVAGLQPMLFADVSLATFQGPAYAQGYFRVLGAPVLYPARIPGSITGEFFRHHVRYLQGNFAYQPGNSGGPVTMANRVIGVTAAITSGSGVIIPLPIVHITLMTWCGLNEGNPTIDEMLQLLAA